MWKPIPKMDQNFACAKQDKHAPKKIQNNSKQSAMEIGGET